MFIKDILRLFMTILYKRKGNPLLDQILRPKISRRGNQSKFILVLAYQTPIFLTALVLYFMGKLQQGPETAI